MTKLLFLITGERKYADWYEKTFINSVLSSQNPRSGMTTYFQPMAGGYHKVYGDRFTKFWCCTGTGMENFSKLQESFCFSRKDCLVVNQYFSFEAVYRGTIFTMEADLLHDEKVILTIRSDYAGDIFLRLPSWLAGAAVVTVDGVAYSYEEQDGYAILKGPFAAGGRVEMLLPMQVEAHTLPDGRNTYAFSYGPFVLSALLGTKDMQEGVTGVDVTVSQNRLFETSYLPSGTDKITVTEGDVETYIAQIHKWLVRSEEKGAFVLLGTDATLTFVPHFSQHAERIFRNCRERRVCEITFRAPDMEDSAAICNFLYTIV